MVARVSPVTEAVESRGSVVGTQGSGHRDARPSLESLQSEIDSARQDLAATLAQVREQTSPAAFVRRGRAAVTGFFVDEHGGVRPERVAMAAGALVTLVVLRRWRRSRRIRYCTHR